MLSMEALGAASAAMASLAWAVGVTRYSILSKTHSGFAVNFSRALVASTAFFLAVFVSGFFGGDGPASFLQVEIRHLGWLGLSVLASYAVADVCFLTATRMIGVSSALVIASLYPLWSALVGWWLRGEELSALQLVGVILIVLGTGMVVRSASRVSARVGTFSANPDNAILEAPSQIWLGILLAFITSVLWAVNTYAVKMGGEGISVFTAGAVRMLIAFLLCPLVAILVTRRRFRPVPILEMRRIWPIYLFEGFGGAFFYLSAMKYAPLGVAASLTAIAPVLTVMIGWIMRTESFSVPKVLGVLVTVTGILLLVSG